MTDQVSYPYDTTGAIVLLHRLILTQHMGKQNVLEHTVAGFPRNLPVLNLNRQALL